MSRRKRGAAVFSLAVFSASLFSLWGHDHVGHEAPAPPCAETPVHVCTEEGHHRADPCVFCSLRVSGQELEGEAGLTFPFQPAGFCEIPDRTVVFGVFLPLPPPRGPPDV